VLNTSRQQRRGVLAGVAGGVALLAVAIAVQAGLIPLSFAPFDTVSLGPPNCEESGACSEGAIAATAGDFNRDGNLDIATANYGSDDITVLLGDGESGLTSSFTADSPGAPASIASGNLNDDDTDLDLVVSKDIDNKIGVFIGKGDGTFEDEVEYDMGNSPEGVVLADFNGDEKLDVATADAFGDTVSVRLGVGDGTFGELKQTTVGGGPYGLAAGRLDGDQIIDLAVTLYDESRLATLIGNGDGTFLFAGTAAAAEVDDAPVGVALADFNDDGNLDAGVATESFDSVDVLLGNGDGTFGPFTSYQVGAFPESVAAGDYNGDGVVDLASADSLGTIDFDGSVSVLLGMGDGTFEEAVAFEVDPGPYGIVAADLNDDRLPDLVTANIDDTTISVLTNTGTPPTPSCVGDCNDDGMVAINELILGVNIALGSASVDDCPAFDENGNGMVGINELVAAVNNALGGCPVG
jgi:FG-GAP-like repeat